MTCKTVNLSEISLDMDKYCQILPNIFKYCPYCQISPDILQYYQILPISVQNCFTLSDIVKNVNLVLVNIANLLLNTVIYCQYFVERYFKCNSSDFEDFYMAVRQIFQGHFMSFSRVFQIFSNIFQTVFHWCFMNVSRYNWIAQVKE